jgi:hypothetical protein
VLSTGSSPEFIEGSSWQAVPGKWNWAYKSDKVALYKIIEQSEIILL